MISLIICSRTGSITAALGDTIETTIGVPYETIVIDNTDNRYNIFQAYNIGVSKSSYSILCFMHDDIEYHTNNWGEKVLRHFEDAQTGAIGIAGSPYVPAMPGSWWGGGLVNQHLLVSEQGKLIAADKSANTSQENKQPVITLDGVWICFRKELFNKISFDEATYKGFHFYDVDTALQVYTAGYHLYCIGDIDIYHQSSGRLDNTWCENALQFNHKWKQHVPLSCIKLGYTERINAELRTLNEFIGVLVANGMPSKTVYRLAMGRVLKLPSAWFYYKSPAFFAIYLVRYFNPSPKAA